MRGDRGRGLYNTGAAFAAALRSFAAVQPKAARPELTRAPLLLASLVLLAAAFFASPAPARVSGPCANCHTMHNSQDGSAMAYDASGASDATANKQLLITDCVGCHSANDGATWKNAVGAPIVYNTVQPTYGADAGDGKKNGLAGGNFYWVTQDDSFGHNVFTQDATLERAPGRDVGCQGADSCHVNLWMPVTDDGVGGIYLRDYGCMKCHMLRLNVGPYHHAVEGADPQYQPGVFYRFLQGHRNSRGVYGIEDPDWEYTRSSSDHNEYLGVPGDKTSNLGASANGNTVSSFCIGCHNIMHVQDDTATGASPWLRHPSDQTLPADGEFAGYTVYDPQVPVARPVLSEVSAVVTPGTDMVMCLSCHRAHGSPYPDMLRFPYDGMVAGGGGADGTGCFKCHTQKDGS